MKIRECLFNIDKFCQNKGHFERFNLIVQDPQKRSLSQMRKCRLVLLM